MQSVKNTAVSIILLFLSYGVYQVITKPLPSDNDTFETASLSVVDTIEENAEVADNLNLPPTQQNRATNNDIPPQLLELDLPESKSFASNPAIDLDVPEPNFPELDARPTNQFSENNNQAAMATTAASGSLPHQDNRNDNNFIVNQTPEIPLQPNNNAIAEDASENQTISYDAPRNELNNATQFDSDSQIIPSTIMGAVAQKPLGMSEDTQPVSMRPRTLAESWTMIEEMVNESKFHDALYELSGFYQNGNFQAEETTQLMDWLDALAAKVIYSTEQHIQSMPYIVQAGDTIGSLARTWQVPAQLIYNINSASIPDPNNLTPGTELKIIEGPFDAEIDSEQGIMTLYLDELYAGRFEIKSSSAMRTGETHIIDKSAQDQLDRPFWISLGNGGSIYASEDAPRQPNELGMNLREAEEIFSILSATSKIRILR